MSKSSSFVNSSSAELLKLKSQLLALAKSAREELDNGAEHQMVCDIVRHDIARIVEETCLYIERLMGTESDRNSARYYFTYGQGSLEHPFDAIKRLMNSYRLTKS